MKFDRLGTVITTIIVLLLPFSSSLALEQTEYNRSNKDLFAVVNGEAISLQEYRVSVRNGARNRFYHGQPPEHEVDQFQWEIGQALIDGLLQEQEAKRRGIEPNPDEVDKELEEMVQRLSSHPQWEAEKEGLLVKLKDRIARKNMVDQLDVQIRNIPSPTSNQLSTYYKNNPDQFTSPQKERVSILLLKVEPWASTEEWAAATEKAESIERQIRSGEKFSAMAKVYSQDHTAPQGGDMGYLHQGMLGGPAQKAIDGLSPGEISRPVQILEGIALFKLTEREQPRLNPFIEVEKKVKQLWVREEQEAAANRLLVRLRRSARLEILDQNYLKLSPESANDYQITLGASVKG